MGAILVTGGAGYVGSVLLRHLLNEGYSVTCVDNLMHGGESLLGVWTHPHFVFYKADITDTQDIQAILREQNFLAVVHLAAIVGDPACQRNPDLAQNVNWQASRDLFRMSQDLGVERFIFASTCSNYGKMAGLQGYVDESSPLAPVSWYAELKVRFEELILEKGGQSQGSCPTSLRFATVYGTSPRMRFDLTINEFTKELALGRELLVYGEQFWRPYCHVADFSRAILRVLQAEKAGVAHNVFNVGDTQENYTKKMIVAELLRHFPGARIKRVEAKEDPRDYRVKFDKIKNEVGFNITRTVPQGIAEVKKVVQWGIIRDPEDRRYYNIPH
jgi:nucleoside-diphosphate-sugar epimerase